VKVVQSSAPPLAAAASLIRDETGYEEGRPSERTALHKRPRAGLLGKPPFSEGLAIFKVNLVSYEISDRTARNRITF
jgi:hypothetical protein